MVYRSNVWAAWLGLLRSHKAKIKVSAELIPSWGFWGRAHLRDLPGCW